MNEELNRKLEKEIEEILQAKDASRKAPAACAHHRMVPPPGCILGWDMAQCDFCSFYQPVEMPEKRKEEGDRR